MNIVEAFFITLSMDTSDYEKKQKQVTTSLKKFGEASDKQTKVIAEGAKKAASAFSALKIEILGAIAAYGLGDGIKGFIESNVTGNAALGRQAAMLKMSAADLKAWGYAAQSVGGKAEDATNALQSVAAGFAEARNKGSSPLIQASWRYGFAVSDDPVQTLLSLSRRMAEAAKKYGPQQALQIADAAGVNDWYAQQLLMLGPDRLEKLVAHYRKRTGHVDTKDAIAFQGTLTDIRADIGNLRDDLFAKMAPAMEVFAKKFEAFLDKITPKLEALVERFGKWLESIDWNKVASKVEELFRQLQQIIKALGGVKGILIEIAAIKAFSWMAGVAGYVIQLRALAKAIGAARLAAAAAGASGTVASAAEGAVATRAGGFLATLFGASTASLLVGAGALVYSKGTGGRRRADGTYEDEISSAQLAATANAARALEAKHRAQAMAYFTSQGWTPQQAAGIVANLTAESGLRTNAYGDNGQAYGLAQWHKDRQRAFEKFTGRPIQGSSFAQQLAFVNHELQTSEKRAGDWLKRAGNAYMAGALVSLMYERPAGGQVEAERRARMAQMMSNAYVGAQPEIAKAKSSTTTNTVTINGMTVNTQATDANGVAKGMKRALLGNPLIAGSVGVLH
ncbi:MAG TPA: phage tail tip lysozyme [Rhodanobacteraceae bacterium]|nr:phage tail tip lysozyme [Rhodanobacteraceae bacterium]